MGVRRWWVFPLNWTWGCSRWCLCSWSVVSNEEIQTHSRFLLCSALSWFSPRPQFVCSKTNQECVAGIETIVSSLNTNFWRRYHQRHRMELPDSISLYLQWLRKRNGSKISFRSHRPRSSPFLDQSHLLTYPSIFQVNVIWKISQATVGLSGFYVQPSVLQLSSLDFPWAFGLVRFSWSHSCLHRSTAWDANLRHICSLNCTSCCSATTTALFQNRSAQEKSLCLNQFVQNTLRSIVIFPSLALIHQHNVAWWTLKRFQSVAWSNADPQRCTPVAVPERLSQ